MAMDEHRSVKSALCAFLFERTNLNESQIKVGRKDA